MPMLFLASMGETGLSYDIFFKFSLGPFTVAKVEWRSMLNFQKNSAGSESLTLHLEKVRDLCMTNGSKVLKGLSENSKKNVMG